MSDGPSLEELDAMSTDELRERAFDLAESRRDVGFFWDVVKHLRASGDIAAEDASSGNITGSIAEAVEIIHNMTSGDLGEFEPMLRARFIDYLRKGGG
jgi:hypothetical protein